MNTNIKACGAVLVASNEYELGAVKFVQRLKGLNTIYPIEVLVTENVTPDLLIKENISYRVVPFFEFEKTTLKREHHRKDVNQIHIFNMLDYDLVCYCDCDMIFYKNPDFIITENLDLINTSYPVRFFDNKCGMYNTLIIIARPNAIYFEGLKNKINLSKFPITRSLFYDYFSDLNFTDNQLVKVCLSTDIIERAKFLHFPGKQKYGDYTNIKEACLTKTSDEFNKLLDKSYSIFRYYCGLTRLQYLTEFIFLEDENIFNPEIRQPVKNILEALLSYYTKDI